jgi:transcriptional regulator with XRE-family HTH domain
MPITEWFIGPGEDDNKAFGDWLRQLRHTAELSRTEAGNKLSFTADYVRLIEQGKRTPASENMSRIFEAYEVIYEKPDSHIWHVDDKIIAFTSRIIEARSSDEIEIPTTINRLETLGWIVDHLNQVEDFTLVHIQKLLQRDLDT